MLGLVRVTINSDKAINIYTVLFLYWIGGLAQQVQFAGRARASGRSTVTVRTKNKKERKREISLNHNIALLDYSSSQVPAETLVTYEESKCGMPFTAAEPKEAPSTKKRQAPPVQRTAEPDLPVQVEHHHTKRQTREKEVCDQGKPAPPAPPGLHQTGTETHAADIALGNQSHTTIPTATAALRASTMAHLEASPGWIVLASQIATDAKQALETACDNDQLLTSAEIRHPFRLRAAQCKHRSLHPIGSSAKDTRHFH